MIFSRYGANRLKSFVRLALVQAGTLWLHSLVKAAYSSAGIRAISSYWRCKLRTSARSCSVSASAAASFKRAAVPSLTSRSKLARLKTSVASARPSALPSGATVSASKSMTVMAYR